MREDVDSDVTTDATAQVDSVQTPLCSRRFLAASESDFARDCACDISTVIANMVRSIGGVRVEYHRQGRLLTPQ